MVLGSGGCGGGSYYYWKVKRNGRMNTIYKRLKPIQMKTTPFFYFSGKRAYWLAYLGYCRRIPSTTLTRLLKNIEVILDSRINLVAMRFEKAVRAGKDLDLIDNNWTLTKRGKFLPWEEQQELIAFCKDLKENGEKRSSNLSGSEADKIQESLFKKKCREIDCLLVLIDRKILDE